MPKPHPRPPEIYNMDGLLEIMRELRDPETGCAWDVVQTFESISDYTVEEAYEVIDAIHKQDYNELAEELGDLLLQPVFHAQIAAEKGLFDFDKVIWNICDKMVRRHPHVFADKNGEVVPLTDGLWQRIKDTEKAQKVNTNPYILDEIPYFPAVKHAQKLQAKAATLGFDWPNIKAVKEKISEELNEFYVEIENDNKQNQQEEFGDLLFSLINYGRHLGLDCDLALQNTNKKFIRRFNYIEDTSKLKGKSIDLLTLDEMDLLWNEAQLTE
ncbi:MAG: nucleoside triphosphate pyrophosphohydrolase [Rhizobiales bacterium]|nr:nucleoside triphosphate pyrophosphohydrolase [Hyphomicrobiales bacterium]